MDFSRHVLRLLAIVAALLLASCIDGREEIWLNADGSGRADIRYSLPAAAARFQGGAEGVGRMLGEFLKTAPGLTHSNHEVVTEGDRLKIRVQASFDSARDLGKVSRSDPMHKLPSSANGLAGEVKVAMDGRTIDFSRKIAAGNALPGIGFMPGSPMKDRNLTYILHLPVAAVESNAMRVENEGRTLVWDYPLAQAVKGPVVTRFKVRVPVPGWLWATGAGGVAVVAAGMVFSWRRFLRRNVAP